MTIETKKFSRRPFDVEAIRVTKTNMEGVAEWCKGNVIDVEATETTKAERFIQVDVHAPATERQSRAFPGDYVLLLEGGKSFKVYTTKAFNKNFVPSSSEQTPKVASKKTNTQSADKPDVKPANGIKPEHREALRKMNEGAQKAADVVAEKASAVVQAITSEPKTSQDEAVQAPSPIAPVPTEKDLEILKAAAVLADRSNTPAEVAEQVIVEPEVPKKRKFVQQSVEPVPVS